MQDYASGKIRGDMVTVAVCEKLGWDYYTYKAQPRWFLRLLHGKLEIDAKEAERERKKQEAKSNHHGSVR